MKNAAVTSSGVFKRVLALFTVWLAFVLTFTAPAFAAETDSNAAKNPNATYVCMSRSHADCPDEIRDRSICLAGDAHEILRMLK